MPLSMWTSDCLALWLFPPLDYSNSQSWFLFLLPDRFLVVLHYYQRVCYVRSISAILFPLFLSCLRLYPQWPYLCDKASVPWASNSPYHPIKPPPLPSHGTRVLIRSWVLIVRGLGLPTCDQKSMGLEPRESRSQSPFCHLLAVWLWVNIHFSVLLGTTCTLPLFQTAMRSKWVNDRVKPKGTGNDFSSF